MESEFIRLISKSIDLIKRKDQIDSFKKTLTYDHVNKIKDVVPSISVRFVKEELPIGISLCFESIEERDIEFEKIAKELNVTTYKGNKIK